MIRKIQRDYWSLFLFDVEGILWQDKCVKYFVWVLSYTKQYILYSLFIPINLHDISYEFPFHTIN